MGKASGGSWNAHAQGLFTGRAVGSQVGQTHSAPVNIDAVTLADAAGHVCRGHES